MYITRSKRVCVVGKRVSIYACIIAVVVVKTFKLALMCCYYCYWQYFMTCVLFCKLKT